MRRRHSPIPEGPDLSRRRRYSPPTNRPQAIVGHRAPEPNGTNGLWVVVEPCLLGCHFMALLYGVGQIVSQAEVRNPMEAFWLMMGWLQDSGLPIGAWQKLCDAAYQGVEAANQTLRDYGAAT